MSQKTTPSSADGSGQPIIHGLTIETTSYTFFEERGLLFSTQFSQPAIALMEIAEFAHLGAQGVVQNEARFAGHSLGEYSALGSCTSFLSLENLLDLIFYRGLRMQNTVQRDENGRTEYSMMAVNPSKVAKSFSHEDLESVIGLIRSQSQLLLEVVNHNVKQQQYVCAGNLHALHTLSNVLDALSIQSNPETLPTSHINHLIHTHLSTALKLPTIPLKGIDIPFHSTLLRGEIDNYRQYLRGKLSRDTIEPEQLVGKFIPNVMGKPFQVTKTYVQEVAEVTGSAQLRQLGEGMA